MHLSLYMYILKSFRAMAVHRHRSISAPVVHGICIHAHYYFQIKKKIQYITYITYTSISIYV